MAVRPVLGLAGAPASRAACESWTAIAERAVAHTASRPVDSGDEVEVCASAVVREAGWAGGGVEGALSAAGWAGCGVAGGADWAE